jgi:hypothetical protein
MLRTSLKVSTVAIGLLSGNLFAADQPSSGRKERGVKKIFNLSTPEDDRDTEVLGDVNDATPLGYGAVGRGPGKWGKFSGYSTTLRGAYILGERWEIGVDFRDISPVIPYATSSKLDGVQRAFMLGYVDSPHKLVHAAYRLHIGSLASTVSNNQDNSHSNNSFFILQPEVAWELNATKYTRISATFGYRLAMKGSETTGPLKPADVMGFDVNLMIGFGNFRF